MAAIRRMRSIKAGHAGAIGGMAYQHALHEMVNGTEEDRVRATNPPAAGPAAEQEAAPKAAPKTPPATAARGTPPGGACNGPMRGWDGHNVRPPAGGQSTPKPEGPKAEKKQGASEDPKELRERTEAEAAGKAMDMTTGGLAAAIP
eukprot:11650871-Heterocapsa_arctica.AAC.1